MGDLNLGTKAHITGILYSFKQECIKLRRKKSKRKGR